MIIIRTKESQILNNRNHQNKSNQQGRNIKCKTSHNHLNNHKRNINWLRKKKLKSEEILRKIILLRINNNNKLNLKREVLTNWPQRKKKPLDSKSEMIIIKIKMVNHHRLNSLKRKKKLLELKSKLNIIKSNKNDHMMTSWFDYCKKIEDLMFLHKIIFSWLYWKISKITHIFETLKFEIS